MRTAILIRFLAVLVGCVAACAGEFQVSRSGIFYWEWYTFPSSDHGPEVYLFNVANEGIVQHASLRLSVRVKRAAGLHFALVAPSGTRQDLIEYADFSDQYFYSTNVVAGVTNIIFNDGGSHFQDTLLDDTAVNVYSPFNAPSASSEYPGGQSYRPSHAPLSIFNGESANGAWRLEVTYQGFGIEPGVVDGLLARGESPDTHDTDPSWTNAIGTELILTSVPGTIVPSLSVGAAANQIQLRWTTNATGFSVETSSSLSGVSWQPLVAQPATVGNQYVVPVDRTVASMFFRLRK
ncbi:MAG: hypothetical protein ACYDH9_12635 [Limisphaerales bacterium]